MLTKSPSGALSPYYYKGGYFHGIHYGSYFDNMDAFLEIMSKEEAFIMRFNEKRRIMIDLYETNLTDTVLTEFVLHIKRMSGKIIKLAISAEKAAMKKIRKALIKNNAFKKELLYFSGDMEECKTWLVSD